MRQFSCSFRGNDARISHEFMVLYAKDMDGDEVVIIHLGVRAMLFHNEDIHTGLVDGMDQPRR